MSEKDKIVDSEQSAKEDDNEFSFQTATGDGVEFEQHPLTSLSLSHSQDSAALAHHPRAPILLVVLGTTKWTFSIRSNLRPFQYLLINVKLERYDFGRKKKRHTNNGDTHYDISPNEDHHHHMEREVLFHTLFHPAVF